MADCDCPVECRREAAAVQDARAGGSMANFMSSRKIGTAMWVMRLYTILLSIQYIFFCSAFDMRQYFTRALLANAVICALRLHQRIPEFRLTPWYISQMMSEDSGHFLMYSLIFLTGHSITIALIPVAVFALLHACSFTRQMIDLHGGNSYPPLRKVINHVAWNQGLLFRFVALTELLLLPTTIAMVFAGRALIFTPFLYYRFLYLRYLSKRNPYCRLLFYEIRRAFDKLTASPFCPSLLRSIIYKVVSLMLKLAPSASSFHEQFQADCQDASTS